MNAAAKRYSSPLRAEQSAATRQRILDAAIELSCEVESGDVGIPDVAQRAGVSVSTAYRAFPTRDAMLQSVLAELERRFEAVAGPSPDTLDALVAGAGRAVRAVFEVEPLYRALFATPAGRELHRTTASRRGRDIDTVLADVPGLTAAQARRFAAIAHLVGSSRSVLFLKDYEGLDVDEAAQVVRWALRVLIAAAHDPEQRSDL